MNKSKEVVEVYYIQLGEDYKRKTIRLALEILEGTADAYKTFYMPVGSVYDEDFTPHNWVVAGVCEALESKKFWKGTTKRDEI